ncbi:hypothetical protein [Chthonomonas calidirosea]|uniref:hypothetical protein n=1 Tax=Chthonomonas calidirosea TaxID=454171 RepID=UPI0012E39B4F|nr:hypothetical protein [Chthonomonas calidirosea]
MSEWVVVDVSFEYKARLSLKRRALLRRKRLKALAHGDICRTMDTNSIEPPHEGGKAQLGRVADGMLL